LSPELLKLLLQCLCNPPISFLKMEKQSQISKAQGDVSTRPKIKDVAVYDDAEKTTVSLSGYKQVHSIFTGPNVFAVLPVCYDLKAVISKQKYYSFHASAMLCFRVKFGTNFPRRVQTD